MTDLPMKIPYVLTDEFILYADEAIAEFVRQLKPVNAVLSAGKNTYLLYIDSRYAYNDTVEHRTHRWLTEQIESQLGNAAMAGDANNG